MPFIKQQARFPAFVTNPIEIEKRSFEIISEKLAGKQIDPRNENVIKRVIHTTADFDYADNLFFSDDAVETAKNALKNGARIVTDTQMVKAGINKKAAAQLGCDIHCFIDAQEVINIARLNGFTRAWAAVDHAAKTLQGSTIFVVGNAPTALIRLREWITRKEADRSAGSQGLSGCGFLPVLVIAVPVGFVNVVESKEMILGLHVPHIVARGQKGGSNVAAAICNALLYETTERVLS